MEFSSEVYSSVLSGAYIASIVTLSTWLLRVVTPLKANKKLKGWVSALEYIPPLPDGCRALHELTEYHQDAFSKVHHNA
jgi:hypothetical protein